jgi:hypothetical protein
MDIRPQVSGNSNEPTSSVGKEGHTKFKASVVNQASASLMLPPAVKNKLSHLSKVYGLPIDLGEFSLDKATPENVKGMRKVTEMLVANSKLLPEILKMSGQVMKADMKVSEFHKNITKAAIKHQEKIDKDTAEIFLAMARYGAKASKLEARVNTRNQLIEKRTQAYEKHYENSIFGDESRIIDVEYEIAASNQKILGESKAKKMGFNSERKQKMQQYIDSAFEA